MKLKLIGLALIISLGSFAQSDYIQLGNKQYQLLNRLDIKLRNDSTLGFTTAKPYNRKTITERVEQIDSLDKAGGLAISLTPIDRYNIQRLLMNNVEWVKGNYRFDTSKPFLKKFYRNPAHFAAVKGNDFFFTVDPILNLSLGTANDHSGSLFQNTRGVVIRGNVDKRIGFYTYLTENQERDPLYVRDYVNKYQALPGVGFLKTFKKTGYDYFDARGGITFNAGRHFDFQFAYDRLYLGNGYRSLFLSDFATNYMFLRINTRFWKLNYQNIFAELIAPFNYSMGDNVRPKKFLAAHHLSFQAAKWLNLGLFENIMFARNNNGFELSYLNPVIFYRSAEQQLGSADKATVGLDFKSNLKNNLQLYGQLVINELHVNEVAHYGRNSWLNKHAVQLGAKYVDAFKVKNLDLQAEMNIVRPYTFSHRDSVTSYSHYNQQLAHPLGAGFREFILNINYQPLPKYYFNAKLIAWKQGLDSAGLNFGSNIFRGYNTRPRDYGFAIGTGTPVNALYGNVSFSYEFFENMFLDASALFRTYKVKGAPDQKLSMFSLGLRMNIAKREYEF